MSEYTSLRYAARLHCPDCSGGEPLSVEDAWWEGDDLHLVHDDGTEVVIKDAEERGYSKERFG